MLNTYRRLNSMSLKKVAELNGQVDTRMALCKRVGGMSKTKIVKVTISGKPVELTLVFCIGGRCEVCHQIIRGMLLDPHHKIKRSQGGKFTLDNILMAHRNCHNKQHR